MSTDTLVSVITPVFNMERTINQAIESVRAQTLTDWEMLIIDDGSTDQSRPLIREAAALDQRIQTVFLGRNLGAAAARNAGIKRAKGRYLAFLDGDDFWMPEKLERQIDWMQSQTTALSFTAYEHMNTDGLRTGRIIGAPQEMAYEDLLKGNQIGCSTVMLDASITGRVQMPRQPHEDYLTWLSILKRGNRANGLNEVLTLYRKTRGLLTANRLQCAKWTWQIYRQHEKLSLPKAVYCFAHYAIGGIRKNH